MGSKQIRIGQLVGTFGPGSIYTDRRGTPHVVAGLDHWFTRPDPVLGLVQCENPSEFERFEPRLAALLNVDRFRSPPDFRARRAQREPPPNAALYVPALRFPRWYRHTRTGQMCRFNLHTARVDRPSGGGRWQPIRFLSVCAGGHLCEFPWKEWIGCQCSGDGNLFLIDRGGSELSSIRVECHTCPPIAAAGGPRDASEPRLRGRNLSGTTVAPDVDAGERSAFQKAGIACPGDRPWLGEGASEPGCSQPLIGALINQTNLYFPRTMSSIFLPDLAPREEAVTLVRNQLEQEPGICGVARTLWNMRNRSGAVAVAQDSLKKRSLVADDDQVERALEGLFSPTGGPAIGGSAPASPESEIVAFRRTEFDMIRNEINDPERVPNLRVVRTEVPEVLRSWVSRVNLVERLRETRVFFGFDRLQQGGQPLGGMPDNAMRQLFREPPRQAQEMWLPAVEVFGEGIYVELDHERIIAWQRTNDDWLRDRLDETFIWRLQGVFQCLPPLTPASRSWASKYLLVHSLAHILINQLVFECGYSTASLRERLYVSDDPDAPMAGILIYTAAGDSEGTLGGLVRLGRPERLAQLFERALSKASWCSADPICSENLGGTGSRLANLAGCHACILLPETSCETINQGLDRAMVVGTPARRQQGWMAALLDRGYTLG